MNQRSGWERLTRKNSETKSGVCPFNEKIKYDKKFD